MMLGGYSFLLPDPGHHHRVNQPPLASRTLALDPFAREAEGFIEADSTLIVGVDAEFDADQAEVVIGDVEKRLQELAPDAATLELIVHHDVRDLAGMVHAAVKSDQSCRPNDAVVDLRHELVSVRTETLDPALAIQPPLRWDVQCPREDAGLMANRFQIPDRLKRVACSSEARWHFPNRMLIQMSGSPF